MLRSLDVVSVALDECHRQAVLPRQADWSRQIATIQEQLKALGRSVRLDHFRQVQPRTQFCLDTRKQPELLQRAGQVQALKRMVGALVESPAPLPKAVYLEVRLPDREWIGRVERGVETGNRIVRGDGLMNRLKRQTLRLITGMQGRVYPIVYQRIGLEDGGKILLGVNLSNLSKEDLVKFASFIERVAG